MDFHPICMLGRAVWAILQVWYWQYAFCMHGHRMIQKHNTVFGGVQTLGGWVAFHVGRESIMARRGVRQSTAEFLSRQRILFGAGLAALAACSASRASYLRALLTVFVLISVRNGHLATRQSHATATATAYLHYNLLVNESMAEVVRVLMKSGRASVSKHDRPRDHHDKSFMDYMYVWQSMDDKHFKDIFLSLIHI